MSGLQRVGRQPPVAQGLLEFRKYRSREVRVRHRTRRGRNRAELDARIKQTGERAHQFEAIAQAAIGRVTKPCLQKHLFEFR